MAGDLLPHGGGDEGLVTALGRTVEDLVGRWVGGEGESREGVHDEVHPEELHGAEHGLHLVVVYDGDEGEDHGSDVDGDLKLRKISAAGHQT